MTRQHEGANRRAHFGLVLAVTLLAITAVCRPVFGIEPDVAASGSVDPEATTAQFGDRLSNMLRAGELVSPERLWENLPDERPFAFRTLPPSNAAKQPTDLYVACRKSIVVVGKIVRCEKCDDWHTGIATGFVIGREGIIVTNRHVIAKDEPMKAIAVQTWDGRLLPIVEVLAVSKVNDLAVLKVDADNLAPLPIASRAPVGAQIFVIGHPDKRFYAMTDGIVSGQFLRRDGEAGTEYQEMTVTADFAKGSSGAPVLDRTGAVVGIVRRTTPVFAARQTDSRSNVQMVWKRCIPSSSLLELLSEPSK
jgi:S1-C subfamily serine protease